MIATEVKQFGTELNIATLYTVCMIDFLLFRAALTGAENYSAMAELKEWAAQMNALYPCLKDTVPVMPPQL